MIGSRPQSPANDGTVMQGRAVQPGEALPTVARKEGEVIAVGSQNRKYRLVAGPPGPVGPWGKRVGLSLSLSLSLRLSLYFLSSLFGTAEQISFVTVHE